jgi:hypothetical protein
VKGGRQDHGAGREADGTESIPAPLINVSSVIRSYAETLENCVGCASRAGGDRHVVRMRGAANSSGSGWACSCRRSSGRRW